MLDRRRKRIERQVGAHDNGAARVRMLVLTARDKSYWGQFLAQRAVLRVFYNAYDLIHRFRFARAFVHFERLSQRIFVFKEFSYECLIHHCDRWRVKRVRDAYVAPAKNRSAHRLEESRSNPIKPGNFLQLFSRSVGVDGIIPSISTYRNDGDSRSRFHSGKSL